MQAPNAHRTRWSLLLPAGIAAALFSLPGQAEPLFPNPLLLLGSRGTDIVAADFNGDGRLDLAVTQENTLAVAVALGSGRGTFARQVQYEAYPLDSIAVGDFKEDGHLDIVAAGPSRMILLPGRGDGTFEEDIDLPAGIPVMGLAVADFNRDGHLDVAGAAQGGIFCPVCPDVPGDVEVSLGHGDGTFAPLTNIKIGDHPAAIAAADLNGDGRADLVAANTTSDDVSVFLGTGNGTFAPEMRTPAGAFPRALAVRDLDGDGRLDLVVGDRGAAPDYAGAVTLLRGRGDGTFDAMGQFGVGGTLLDLTVGRFDAGATDDLAVLVSHPSLYFYYEAGVALFAGRGDGTFGAQRNFPAASGSVAIAAADLDGNGRDDVAATGTPFADTFGPNSGILLDPGGAPSGARDALAAGRARSAVSGDFDGDGHPDLAVANAGPLVCEPTCGDAPGDVSIALGRATERWRRASMLPSGPVPRRWRVPT